MEEFPLQYFLWLAILFSLSYLYHSNNKQERSSFPARRLPPGPKALPILGNILELGQNPHRSFARLSSTYGPIMFLRLGSVKTIVISSPALAKEILLTNERTLSSRRIPDALKGIYHPEVSVVWAPTNQSWRYLRTLLKNHLFNTHSLGTTEWLRRRKIQELTEFIREEVGKPIDIGRAAFCTMLNIISTTIFSMNIMDLKSDSSQELKDLVWIILKEAGKPNLSDFFPFLAPLDLQGRRQKLTVNFKKLVDLFDQIIIKRVGESTYEERERTNIDVLDVLLQINQEKDSRLSRRTILSLFVDLFVTGTETSSTTVEWAMAELFRQPELMLRAREEVTVVIGFEREVEESDISQLPFLQAVLKETLRLHPPVPLLLPHRVAEDIEVSGYKLLENSQVLVNVWAIGRDENVWDSPDKFMPERFMSGEKCQIDFKGQYFELVPFSSGRRICPGMTFGVRMVQLMLASLIQSFEWRLETKDLDMTEKFGLTLSMASPLKPFATPTAAI